MADDLIKRLLEIEVHFRVKERGAQNKAEKRKYADRAATVREAVRAWQTVKFTVNETAQNNAGENEDVYRILMYVARLMDNQEKGVQG